VSKDKDNPLIISKVLNNNAVVCVDNQGTEKIVMGCGLAFGKKAGAEIETAKIEKEFLLSNKETNVRFQQFIQNIPMERVLLAERIIVNAKKSCSKSFDDSIYISLTDHLNGALERAAKGVVVENPLVSAVKNFYPEEYRLAEEAVEFINRETSVELSVDEIGFFTMHFVTAQLGQNPGELAEVVSFVNDISQEVEKYLLNVDETSISWRRFLTHLTFFAQRIIKEENREDEEDLQKTVKNSYTKAYKIVEEVCSKVCEDYDFCINEDEKAYLAIHVNRLLKECGGK